MREFVKLKRLEIKFVRHLLVLCTCSSIANESNAGLYTQNGKPTNDRFPHQPSLCPWFWLSDAEIVSALLALQMRNRDQRRPGTVISKVINSQGHCSRHPSKAHDRDSRSLASRSLAGLLIPTLIFGLARLDPRMKHLSKLLYLAECGNYRCVLDDVSGRLRRLHSKSTKFG